MGGFELAIPLSRLTALVEKWERQCGDLAKEGNYWEAGRLQAAARELDALIAARRAEGPQVIKTDEGVRKAYEDAVRPAPLYQQPTTFPLPPGVYPSTRVVD